MRIYGLIGTSLQHSFSKDYFSDFFSKKGISASYENYEISNAKEFTQLIASQPNLLGLNITTPFKTEVIPYISEINPIAKNIGAINVVKINRNKNNHIVSTTGFNTDVIGFENSIKPHLNSYHTHALILGTGGASLAIDYVLRKNSIKTLFVSRIENKNINSITYADLTKTIIDRYTIVVNCTPCGTFPDCNTCPPFRYDLLTNKHLCYDLVYNPPETLFLKKALEKGAKVINGQQMLIIQAQESWKIWNNS